MTLAEEKKQKLIRSIRGIVLSRWLLIIGLGLVGVVQRIAGFGVLSLTPNRLLILVVLPIAYNLFFSVYIRREPDTIREASLRAVAILQVLVDLVMITFVIYFTGGVESVNFMIYFFPLLTVTILFSDVEIILLALVLIGLYTGLITLEFHELIPHYTRYREVSDIFQNPSATLLNTMTIDLTILLLSLLAVFVNRIIHDRELQITIERDKVRSILNSLEEGIILLDMNKRILSMNPPARAMLRLYNDEEILHLDKKHFPKNFHPFVQTILSQPKKNKTLTKEIEIQEGDDTVYVQVDSIPIQSNSGEILSWVKVLHDITREKELDQVKSDFISVAAHQLRTPLAGLKWFFKMMRDGDAGDVTKKQQELLDQAFQKNNQVIDIVNDLLDVSEIEEGRSPFTFTDGNVLTLLQEVVEKSTMDAEHKEITIDFKKPRRDVPPVRMDKSKLSIVFQNILDNAIKYSPKGSTVTITFDYKNHRNYVSITDQGIGIAKGEQQKIFSKFFRASNAKEEESNGSGLGLYIVRNIVQKHGGQIWFESEGKGKGTTFFVTVPVPRQYIHSDY